MWRRIVLVLSVIGMVAGCGGAAETTTSDASAAQPEQTFKWRLVTTWPKNFPGMGMAPEKLADRVREMSNGRLDIKVYGAGELVPALEIFEAVSQGTVQMGHGAAYYWRGSVPAAQLFTADPLGYPRKR